MNQKNFSSVAGAIFLLMAILHLLRLTLGWQPMLNGTSIPVWVSWVGLAITGYLAYQGITLGKGGKDN